ncbi:Serpentine receptor class alpha/beta-14 [Toxocara canis]|uniref:Serpentine receptor class alpha/beta-14 n=1 Tax=Toxocara canis TaxID=6265 RepID=A0A0B2V2D1_TOXCA|nr:Serpentine receptor class alpha/beta-14 [Toxocara canis]
MTSCGSLLLAFQAVMFTGGLKKMYNAGGTAVVMSTVFLAIERVVATCFYKTYESRGHEWMGVVLSALLWVTFGYACFFLPDRGTAVYHYCDVGIYDAGFAKVADIVLLFVQVFAALIFIGLWYRNYRLKCILDRESLPTLSTRYQLKENISTTKLIIPLVAMNAVLMLSYSVAYSVFLPSLDPSSHVTEDVLNSINAYAPVADKGWVLFRPGYEAVTAVRNIWDDIASQATDCLGVRFALANTVGPVLLMPVATSAFMVCMPLLNIHVRRSLFRLTRLRHCFQDPSSRTEPAQQAGTRLYFEMLEKQWQNNVNS